MKLFMVTSERQVSKKKRASRVVGFVSIFGWEKPEEKAAKKYPTVDGLQVHESRFRR